MTGQTVSAQPLCNPIEFDEPQEGRIDPEDEGCFTFDALVGQRVSVVVSYPGQNIPIISAPPLYVRLETADGSTTWDGRAPPYQSYSAIEDVELPVTGTYRIIVDAPGSATVSYSLAVSCLNCDATLISYDQTIEGMISPMGDRDAFTFDGEEEQHVSVVVTYPGQNNPLFGIPVLLRMETSDGRTSWEGRAPDYHSYNAIEDVELPATGTYRIIVDAPGANTTTYQLSLSCNNCERRAIVFGEPVNDEVSPPGDQDEFTVDGRLGQEVTAVLDGFSRFAPLALRLTAPDGTQWNGIGPAYSSFREICNVILPVTGHYIISVRGPGVATGSYNLAVGLVDSNGEPPPRTIELGSQIRIIAQTTDSGSTNRCRFLPATAGVYRVDASNSGSLFVSLAKDDAWYSTITLKREGAAEVLSTRAGNEDLAIYYPTIEPGRYEVRVMGDRSGYATLTVAPSPTELILGEWHVGTIMRQYGSAWYIVNVPSDQLSLFFHIDTLGIWSRLDVINTTTGERWWTSGATMNLEIPSPAPGLYYAKLVDSAYVVAAAQDRDHIIQASVTPPTPRSCSSPSIASVSPDRGGNAGHVVVSVTGRCLANATSICLVNGEDRICSSSVDSTNDGRKISAILDLQGRTTGTWDLAVEMPDGTKTVEPSAFFVESGGAPDVWVEILSREVIRVGRETQIIVQYGNRGTVDAAGVPLWIAGIPSVASVRLGFDITPLPVPPDLPTLALDDVPVFVDTGTEKMLPLLISVIPPGFSGELSLFVTLPSQVSMQLQAWTWPPLFGSSLKEEAEQCFQAFVRRAVEALAERLLGRTIDLIPGVGCLRAAVSLPANAVEGLGLGVPLIESLNHFLAVLLVAAYDCFKNEIPIVEAAEWTVDLLRAVLLLKSLREECGGIDRDVGKVVKDVSAVTSISPEDKYGSVGHDRLVSADASPRRWITGDSALHYRIDFWNKECDQQGCPAPTQDVIITDMLDADLDWSTLSFREFGFLRWSIPLEGGQYFNVDVDLRPDMNILVNAEGTFDPATGQIEWRFHSLEPISREPPEDPLAGFLPPITDSGYEIGWVEFTVSPKPNLPDGTRIANQAFVKFDVDVFKPAPKDGPWINTIGVDNDDDGVPDAADNCPEAANADQGDADVDGTGDPCDPTPDGEPPVGAHVPNPCGACGAGAPAMILASMCILGIVRLWPGRRSSRYQAAGKDR